MVTKAHAKVHKRHPDPFGVNVSIGGLGFVTWNALHAALKEQHKSNRVTVLDRVAVKDKRVQRMHMVYEQIAVTRGKSLYVS